MARRQLARQVETGRRHHPFVVVVQRTTPDYACRGWLRTQQNVLGDREPRNDRRLLRDCGDSTLERFTRRMEQDWRSVEEHPAIVRLVGAGDDLAESRLPGAV